jgi:putative FmdB family regulatory protein
MPIYAYRCADCGHAKDVLQKISDAPLTTCPSCGAERFEKQVTAAGFQLKGSGWYVTDFRNNSGGAKAETKADAKAETKTESAGENKSAATAEVAPAAPAPAAAPAAPSPPTPSSSSS